MKLNRAIRPQVTKFADEERGSITLQVLIFSLLLLATTGIVLDSGRLYTQHSQMQAYADQMALSAANELDGTSDSIARAVNSVFGQSGGAPYLRKAGVELGEFEVASITFHSSMAPSNKPQNDMRESFPTTRQVAVATLSPGATDPVITFQDGDEAAAASAAQFAVVRAREDSTKAAIVGLTRSILSIGNNDEVTGPRTQFAASMDFGAAAAASVEQRFCADMSTLVFCNPWEDESTSVFDLEPGDPNYSAIGRSLMHFAPNFPSPNGGTPIGKGTTWPNSAYDWDINHQLFKLTGPLADEAGVCSEQNVPRLFDGEDYIVARDRCMMARAQTDTICWGEGTDLTIAPAHGPDVVRAVNTIFDIWHEPFEAYIQDTTQVAGTGLGRHQLFEPDALATTLFELADWYGAGGPGTMQDGNPAQEFADSQAGGASTYDAYFGHVIPRSDYTYLEGVYATGRGVDVCHANTYTRMNSATPSPGAIAGACAVDFVGDHFVGNIITESSSRTEMEGYWSDMYEVDASGVGALPRNRPPAQGCGVAALEQSVPGLAEYCALNGLSFTSSNGQTIDSWYEVYLQERSVLNNALIAADADNSRVTADEDLDGDGIDEPRGLWADGTTTAPDYQTRYGIGPEDDYVKQRPDDFFALTGESNLFAPQRERRRIRAAMVNCEAAVGRGPVGGNNSGTGGNSAAEYAVQFDELRVLDMYLPQPAGFHCGDNVATCDIDQSVDTLLYGEVIQDVTEEATQRFVAKLVR